jgi:hypothetical protein
MGDFGSSVWLACRLERAGFELPDFFLLLLDVTIVFFPPFLHKSSYRAL